MRNSPFFVHHSIPFLAPAGRLSAHLLPHDLGSYLLALQLEIFGLDASEQVKQDCGQTGPARSRQLEFPPKLPAFYSAGRDFERLDRF